MKEKGNSSQKRNWNRTVSSSDGYLTNETKTESLKPSFLPNFSTTVNKLSQKAQLKVTTHGSTTTRNTLIPSPKDTNIQENVALKTDHNTSTTDEDDFLENLLGVGTLNNVKKTDFKGAYFIIEITIEIPTDGLYVSCMYQA